MHRLYTIALAATLLGSPSASAHPEPPPPLAGARHYVAYDAICPKEDSLGSYRCTVYVVPETEPCPVCEPAVSAFSCAAADLNSDGTVDGTDLIECAAFDGAAGQACGAAVRAWWNQECGKEDSP